MSVCLFVLNEKMSIEFCYAPIYKNNKNKFYSNVRVVTDVQLSSSNDHNNSFFIKKVYYVSN